MNDCLFCKIIAGEIPATKVFEDDSFIAILDINPVHPGHTLLVPKTHSRNVLKMERETLSSLGGHIAQLSKAVKKATNADGINVIMNNEPAAGQIVFHTHIHIIPRFDGDGFKHWHGQTKPTPEENSQIQEKIKTVIND